AFLIGPEGGRNDAIGTEHHDQALFPLPLIGEAQAGKIEDERQRRRTDAQVADELTSCLIDEHVISPCHHSSLARSASDGCFDPSLALRARGSIFSYLAKPILPQSPPSVCGHCSGCQQK